MNLASIGQGVLNAGKNAFRAVKSIDQQMVRDAIGVANQAENSLNRTIQKYTPYQGTPHFTLSAEAFLRNKGVLPEAPQGTQSVIRAPQSYAGDLIRENLGAPQPASGSTLRPTNQAINPGTPAQTPSAGTNVVSPSALTSAMNASMPAAERTGRAFVPAPPGMAQASMAVSPMTLADPRASMSTPAPTAAVSPASLASPNSQRQVLAALAARPDSIAPAGYVEAPEGVQFGGRPRRRLRENGAPIF